MPIIQTLRKQMQEDHNFQSSFYYKARPCQKKKKRKKEIAYIEITYIEKAIYFHVEESSLESVLS
jgi:hypothetical protein